MQSAGSDIIHGYPRWRITEVGAVMQTIGHTATDTIKRAPEQLHEIRGWLLAFEHLTEQDGGDQSWFQEARKALDYAVELSKEARAHFTK